MMLSRVAIALKDLDRYNETTTYCDFTFKNIKTVLDSLKINYKVDSKKHHDNTCHIITV